MAESPPPPPAAARKTLQGEHLLVRRLDPEAKCILHVYGNGTRLTHVVLPYGDHLAALRLPALPLTPHQAASLQGR